MDMAADKARKRKIEIFVGKYFANPLSLFLHRIGLTGKYITEIETVGRRSGQTRVAPVTAWFDADGAWLISQHGKKSGWALNALADPRIRLRHGRKWYVGQAEFRPEDDVTARVLASNPGWLQGKVALAVQRGLASDPMVVRVDFVRAPEAISREASDHARHERR
ncbi:nitroreductase family deazaflavin-dependent oxidoreductase [Pseudonocardiaceae bacterium YIM PH 21723]|nr:nitroreductase family deazaflavin-dependent oxidoreductase [Pseudonocardiaceae bacterium YIM PH 21723]